MRRSRPRGGNEEDVGVCGDNVEGRQQRQTGYSFVVVLVDVGDFQCFGQGCRWKFLCRACDNVSVLSARSELLAVMGLCCNVSLFSPLLNRGARETEAENGRVNRDSGEGTAACARRIRAAESERSSYRRRHVTIVLKSIL